ncbi:MFS transporter [bacterium]|nr:MFS transporter [bacterium]
MKNIKLLYWLNASYYTWFWLGVWVLYYSRFGGFAAVGILETVMIISTILFEIPTGAIGDLLGKRKTLLLGYILSSFSQFWMGLAPNLFHMVFALIVMNLGGALRSGTFEAMVYDTLKDEGKESGYSRIIANLTSGKLVVLAISGVVGGFLYKISPELPFYFTGAVGLLGAFGTLFLVEPKTDSEKFTVNGYIKQNIFGFKQLFVTPETVKKTLALLSILFVSSIMYEGLNDIMSVKYGFTEVQLGIFAAILSLAGAGASILSVRLEKKISSSKLFLLGIFGFAVSLLLSPFVGLIGGGVTILIRNIISPILENESSAVINRYVDSKYRATALSAFSMLRFLPYALTIYVVSAAADVYPVTYVVFILGIFTIVAFGINLLVFGREKVSQ